jgi:uncharacterized surface protein with fasciclin (FAS1) repeats
MKKTVILLTLIIITSFGAQAQIGDKLKKAAQSPTGQAAIGTLLSLAQQNPRLSKFVGLVQMAGLTSMLTGSNSSPMTLLAPSNSALEAIAPQISNLSKPENKNALVDMVKNHVLSGNQSISSLTGAKDAPKSMVGNALNVGKTAEGAATINGANIIEGDLKAQNGTVHIIDKVLLPTDKK